MQTPLVVAILALFGSGLAIASRRAVKGRARSPRATVAMHAKARELAREAFEAVIHAQPSADELMILLAVSLHETTFGAGWRAPGNAAYNMGALQAAASWTGMRFRYTDTHPTDTGGAVRYDVDFRAYPNAIEGWKDYVRELYVRRPSVRQAAQNLDVMGVAKAMKRTHYYEGMGKNDAERIRNYAQAIADSILEINTQSKAKS